MPDEPLPHRGLARELTDIDSRCQESAQDPCACLRVTRVVRGLTPEQWRRITEELGLEQWSAEPVAEALASPLEAFLRLEMERTRLCQQPLALAVIRPGAWTGAVLALVRSQLRAIDHVSRLDADTIAVCLSATPLATAERLMGSLLRRIRQAFDPCLLCSAGLVGYGGLARIEPGELLASAGQALDEAARLGGNRLEVTPSADAALASRETLVRASEKHFLFTGKRLPDTRDDR